VRIGFPDSPTLKATSSRPVDEPRYDEAERAAAMRRRDLLLGPANRPRTTAEVTATAEALGLTPRGVWGLLQRMRVRGDGIAHFLSARHAPRAKRLNARAEAIIQQAIDQHYARRSQQSRRRDRRALPGRRLCGTVWQNDQSAGARPWSVLAEAAPRGMGEGPLPRMAHRRGSRRRSALGAGADRQHALRHSPV